MAGQRELVPGVQMLLWPELGAELKPKARRKPANRRVLFLLLAGKGNSVPSAAQWLCGKLRGVYLESIEVTDWRAAKRRAARLFCTSNSRVWLLIDFDYSKDWSEESALELSRLFPTVAFWGDAKARRAAQEFLRRRSHGAGELPRILVREKRTGRQEPFRRICSLLQGLCTQAD